MAILDAELNESFELQVRTWTESVVHT